MGFELEFLGLLQSLRTPFLDALMVGISTLGNKGILWILLTIFFLLIPSKRRTGAVLTCALIADLVLCNIVLKPLFARVRPFDVNTAIRLIIAEPLDFSFPSGHTAAAFASVVALKLAGENRLWKPVLVLAVLMAFSRLYLHVHYPTDVLGGVVTGIASGYLGYAAVCWIEGFRDTRRKNKL